MTRLHYISMSSSGPLINDDVVSGSDAHFDLTSYFLDINQQAFFLNTHTHTHTLHCKSRVHTMIPKSGTS